NISAIKDLSAAEIEVAQLRRINEGLLRCVTTGVVIIDRSYRILTINAAARRLLGVRDLAYDQDFLHTVRGLPYHEVRRAIETAFREDTIMNLLELELDHTSEGSRRYVTLTIMNTQVENGSSDLVVITAHDVSDQI